MIDSWQTFEEQILTGPRFLFAADQASFGEVSFDRFQDFLQTTAAHLQTQIVRRQPAGLTSYRARSETTAFDTAENLGSPPPEKTWPQRLSAAGVQCFYAAEDLLTATLESRPDEGDMISVGQWQTTRPLVVIDFAVNWEIPSIFDLHAGTTRHFDRFIRSFAREISKPADTTGVPANDYLATQVIAEFFRYKLATAFSPGVDAIRYRSSIDPTEAQQIGDCSGCELRRQSSGDARELDQRARLIMGSPSQLDEGQRFRRCEPQGTEGKGAARVPKVAVSDSRSHALTVSAPREAGAVSQESYSALFLSDEPVDFVLFQRLCQS